MNVFAAPGDVFEELKSSAPATSNWLVPVLLSCLVGVVSVFVIFSQPAVQQQQREKQEQQLEKLVASGKLDAEAKQRAQASMESFGMTAVKIAGAFGAVAGSFAWLFALALVLKLLGGTYGFKAGFSYVKAMEIAGLSAMIGLLGGIIQTLLVVLTGSVFVSLGPALLIREFDPANKLHLVLASVNVMTFWYLAVLGIGLSKVSSASFAKAALWLVGLWVILRIGIILAGWAGSGM